MEHKEELSPWWKHALLLTMVCGFTILIWLSARTYRDAPPIPDRVVTSLGEELFTGGDIRAGQQVFLKYGLMENGTVWGHGAYLGPDFSAEYLHTVAACTADALATEHYNRPFAKLTTEEQSTVNADVQQLLKENRYDRRTSTLTLTEPESKSYRQQVVKWERYFSQTRISAGLPANYINDPDELRALTAFFAWTAWASVAKRLGKPYSYTNNFPYDPAIGNTPSSDAVLWSALSLIALLGAIAVALFGRKCRADLHRRERFRPSAPNQVWSLDFVADQLADGRRFRALTVVDVFTRESLAIDVGQRLRGEDVVSTLNQIRSQRGVPKFLHCDNGSEFTSQIMDLWAYQNKVQIDYSRPGKPTDNAYVESFNGTLRAECLDVHWFATLVGAKQRIEAWRREYNESRPHRALGERTPSEFACQIAVRGDLTGSQTAGDSP